ncbi:hypothetical protein XENOCAPTIV_018882 [Xenoophorus captivus]|uniref:Maturase K n=1 Tax=Xenoophorus captivus TaxID=1517983 RepID=A0ABV0SAQ0_9TELE
MPLEEFWIEYIHRQGRFSILNAKCIYFLYNADPITSLSGLFFHQMACFRVWKLNISHLAQKPIRGSASYMELHIPPHLLHAPHLVFINTNYKQTGVIMVSPAIWFYNKATTGPLYKNLVQGPG